MKLVHGKVPLTSSVTVSTLWQPRLTVSLADSMPQLLTKLAQSASEVERERGGGGGGGGCTNKLLSPAGMTVC